MLGDQVWLTVRVLVHPKGVGRGWVQGPSHQTGKSVSLWSWLCHIETGNGLEQERPHTFGRIVYMPHAYSSKWAQLSVQWMQMCMYRCVCVPEWIPVMKRPMMTISGEPQILLKPMSVPPINTSTVVFTTVPFLKVHTHTNIMNIHKSIWPRGLWNSEDSSSVRPTAVPPSPDIHTVIMIDMYACIIPD